MCAQVQGRVSKGSCRAISELGRAHGCAVQFAVQIALDTIVASGFGMMYGWCMHQKCGHYAWLTSTIQPAAKHVRRCDNPLCCAVCAWQHPGATSDSICFDRPASSIQPVRQRQWATALTKSPLPGAGGWKPGNAARRWVSIYLTHFAACSVDAQAPIHVLCRVCCGELHNIATACQHVRLTQLKSAAITFGMLGHGTSVST